MKKLINDPRQVVADFLAGFAGAHHDLVEVDLAAAFVSRRNPKHHSKVAVISGGGSGHEPLHAGFVGYGMLDGAVAGPVFTSPPAGAIGAAARHILQTSFGGRGDQVIMVVKNYTGDVMNFEIAAEELEIQDIKVATVLVNDDVAVEDSLYTAGRRGVGGTLFVEKIIGAGAEEKLTLAEVQMLGEQANQSVRSMGVALHSGILPHAAQPGFLLGEEEIELGIGIHGEPGNQRLPMSDATEITRRLLEPILADLDLGSGENTWLFVNGMGATPLAELYIVYGLAREYLEKRGITIKRSLVGSYVTSLDMQGCSISVARLDPRLMQLWDAPVHTPALRKGM